jgi:tetratricopeptide (TPR) repeat protein
MSGRRDSRDGRRGRTDPVLGSLDNLDGPSPSPVPDDGLPHIRVEAERRPYAGKPVPPPRQRKRGWLLPLVLLLGIGAVTLVYLQQDRLRGMLPATELNDTLTMADQALAAGKLDGTNGDSARELYEKVQAAEPDNDRARDGLRKVGQAEVARADAALNAGNVDEADAATTVANELLGGGNDIERLRQQISRARNPSAQQGSLVDQAQAALDAGKFDGPDGAGALYRKVLDGDPNNPVAARGLDKVGDALAAQARQAIAANDRKTASSIVERIAAVVPNYGDLPSLRASLAETRKQDDQATAGLLSQAADNLRSGKVTGDGDDNALARYKAVLATDPDNAQAKAGLGQVAQALIVRASAAEDAGDNEQARKLLDQAATLAPKSADLAAARARLGDDHVAAASGDAADRASGDGTTPAQLAVTPEQKAQVADLVRRARAATARGDIMTPPADCAYDLYRNALAIDGNDAAARSGLQSLPGVVQKQFENAMSNGNLRHAGELLDTMADLAPGEPGQVGLRQRLASALVDQAQQRGNAGDREGARQSLDAARRLNPDDARLPDAYARLQSGR